MWADSKCGRTSAPRLPQALQTNRDSMSDSQRQREHSEMKALGYTWRVLVNIFYLLVVGAVLTSISDPSEKQIIAVLGLIYVTIRTQAIFQGIGTSTVVADFQKQIDQIRYFVDGNFELPNRDRQIALLEAQQAKLFIDAFF